jgi:hypothetical protein
MNRRQKTLFREFFSPSYKGYKPHTFKCDKCDFTTWANLKLIRHKQEVHSY